MIRTLAALTLCILSVSASAQFSISNPAHPLSAAQSTTRMAASRDASCRKAAVELATLVRHQLVWVNADPAIFDLRDDELREAADYVWRKCR